MSHYQLTLFIIILFAFLFLAAFFSCAETSLMAVNRYRLRHQARMKKRYAIRILQLLKRPDRLLGVILISNTFANMLISSITTLIASHYWGDQGVILSVIVVTFIVLIFAEIAPKTIAAIYPDKIARLVIYPVQWILKCLYPLVWLANAITNGLLSLFHIRVKGLAMEPLSREELRSVVYDATGKTTRRYQTMLLGILDLNKLSVDDIMLPQHEIIGIDIESPWDKIVQQLKQTQEDWVPIFKENVNQLLGVLYVKDVMRLILSKNKLDHAMLLQFLHQPYFIPEGTPLNVQLDYFQRSEDKVGFIVDEYGDIKGLLTLNYILKEIIGDFHASMADAGKRLQLQPDGSYLIDSAITVREFNRLTGWDLPVHGPRTLNGLIVEYLEALPHIGTAVLIAGYPIEIIQVQDNRVKLARVFAKLDM